MDEQPNRDPQSPSSGVNNKAMIVFLGLGMALVFEIGISAGVGFWVGNWVDRKLGSAPIGMLLGLVLFLATSITHAIFTLKQAQANIEKSS